MRKLLVLISCFLLLLSTGIAQQAPAAEKVLREACAQAKQDKKKVLLIFHASWCVWCHRFDSSLNDPVCKKMFEDNFVITHITVHESKGKEQLENPGGQALMDQYNGKEAGLPYWLIFDANGQLISDCRIRKAGDGPDGGDSAGCPATENEVEFFINVLKKTTSLGEAQLNIIRTRFRKNEE